MKYTELEKNTLDMMKRADFRNLSKNDIISIASKLVELRPDVAEDIIVQFPEFTKYIQSSMEEYKSLLENIISSDDESIKHLYIIAEKNMENASDSRKQFYEFAEKVHADICKCINNHELTSEERSDIFKTEIEILKAVSEKDSEIRTQENETVKVAKEKHFEKQRLNWDLIIIASTVLIIGIGLTASAVGANFNLKLSKKS